MTFGKMLLIIIWFFIVGIISEDEDFLIGVAMFAIGVAFIYKM